MEGRKVYKTEGVIIRHVSLGEADRLLTIYSRDFGKMRAVARGARRPKSKMAGHLELLTWSKLLIAKGNTLDVVSQGETIQSFLAIRNDLWLSACGMYIAELVDRFTAEMVANESIYGLLLDTLARLETERNADTVLRYFELRLLGDLGYKPQLHQCVECNSVVAPGAHYFTPSGGGIVCPNCRGKQHVVRPLSLNALKVLRLMLASEYDTIKRLRIALELGTELEQLMAQYTTYLLEDEVKSSRFLGLLRRQGGLDKTRVVASEEAKSATKG